jgi:hypothetical protein
MAHQDDVVLFSRDTLVEIPSIFEYFPQVFSDSDSALVYLDSRGLFYRSNDLVTCRSGNPMSIRVRNHVPFWRCVNNGNCPCNRSERTYRIDSFFFNRRIGVNKVVFILYLWLLDVPRLAINKATKVSPFTIRSILHDWNQVLQEDITEEDMSIGGPGIIVTIVLKEFG